MFKRSTALAVAALAAAAVTAVTVPAATAAPTAPGFLKGSDLPAVPGTSWSTGPVRKGAPSPGLFCLAKAFPVAGTWHRTFGTDLDTGARQVSVRAASVTEAKKLTATLEKKVAACAADWLRKTPGGTASWQDYGKLAVEEGAHVYGVHTAVPESEHGVNLFGIGRDGSTVTVVDFTRMGTLNDVPVAAFKKTTITAVKKLNP
ncbi:hypothetical protein LG634_18280 [Streptomyces bambusae]|uniref:hypothetical protein n=1 Tax=Streptomyces bambusae TaxID=1550616 RepID=UPI001CFED884|nr:hypothetical protein [Streptomyces bambusae]MCB5166781.1 hypothetical protein [Streptomyces bambusae]